MNLESQLIQWAERQRNTRQVPLRLKTWNGTSVDLSGQGNAKVTVTLKNPAAVKQLLRPSLARLGSAYIEGQIDVDGSIWDALQAGTALSESMPQANYHVWWPKAHSRRVDEEAIRYHYDVSNEFYALWLDAQMVYSCGYFKTGQEDIHQAQEQKLDHICRKLMLQRGERFLDIGCGWGGLLRWAAKHYGVEATGITLSQKQYDYAKARIAAEGLEKSCKVILVDYRDHQTPQPYDKIASVGMFEHVGLKNLPVYFQTACNLLKEGGLMLNHGITAPEGKGRGKGIDGGDFIERYVFPHGELPSLSVATHQMAHQNLEILDAECLRPHYAQTLTHWVARLERNQAAAVALVGQKRYRIWQVYMAGCVSNFEAGGVTIYQLLASKQTQPGLSKQPWSRAHLYQATESREPARLRPAAALEVI